MRPAGDAGKETQLEGGNHRSGGLARWHQFAHYQQMGRVGVDRVKAALIRRHVLHGFAARAKGIVGEEAHHGGKI
jgi:hypothetical protein